MKNPIKIIIVDDHNLVLDGLESLINSIRDFQLLKKFNSVVDVLEYLKNADHYPDLIITDVEMPGIDGIQLTKEIKQGFPSIKVLILTMHDESYFINRSILAGADGYLLKNVTRKVFEESVRKVLIGQDFFSVVPQQELLVNEENTSSAKLSPQEINVLKLLAQGKSSKEIAGDLYISSRTVDTHRNNMKRKLKLKTTGQLVRYAFENGHI